MGMHWYVGPLAYTENELADGELEWLNANYPGHAPTYSWAAPPALRGKLLDLRAYGSMANTTDTGGERHFGVVVCRTEPNTTPPGWRLLGSGDPGAITLTSQQRARLGTAAGLTINSNTLAQAMLEIFVYKADPEGLTTAKPIIPGMRNRVTFKGLGNTSGLVLRVHWGRPEFRHLLTHIRKEYKQVQQGASGKHRMWLAQFLDNRFLSRDDYRHFQDTSTPDEPPIEPRTPITESFTTIGATLGGDLSWTEYDSNFQNAGTGVAFKSGSGFGTARADTDLSGGDMYAQVAKNGGQNGWLDLAIRFSSSAETCYWCYTRGGNAANKHTRITKRVSGTDTVLTDVVGHIYPNADYNSRFEISGGDMEVLADDETTSRLTTTDTAIGSSNIRAGVSGRDSGEDSVAYDWEADILAAATPSVALLRRRGRGNG